MNYVQYFNLFGVDAKQIPSITGSGAPTTKTEGAVGCLYMNTDTGDLYKCTAVKDGVYTWEDFGSGGTTTDTSNLVTKGELFDITEIPGKNLLNPNDPDYTVDHDMSGTGTRYREQVGWDTSGYIAVNPGDRIAVLVTPSAEGGVLVQNGTGSTRIYGFDAEKTVVSDAYSYNKTDFNYYTVPEGVAYLRFSFSRASFKTQMIVKLEEGDDGYINPADSSTYRPYEPFGAVEKIILIKPELYKVPTKLSELENDVGFGQKASKPLALPPKMYAFANQPVVTFLQNILPYHPDDVYVRMTTSNKGKLYKDRWEYTPTGAETVSVKYIVCDHDYNELNNDTFSLVVKDTTTRNSLKVLVIGDSTVNAGAETQKMLDLATADGYGLTLLGTRGTAGSTNQHEGRGGWTAEMYCTKASNTSGSVVNPFYNPDTETFDFTYYMEQKGYSGVDCVFIQLGINDLFAFKKDTELAAGVETYLSCMEIMVNSIHEYDPNIRIVLNMIIPCCDDQDEFTAGGGNYGMVQTTWRCRKNTYDGNIALLNKFNGKTNIYISHFNAALDTVNNMDGGVHPVQAGYEQLGTQMYSFMRALDYPQEVLISFTVEGTSYNAIEGMTWEEFVESEYVAGGNGFVIEIDEEGVMYEGIYIFAKDGTPQYGNTVIEDGASYVYKEE